MQSNTITESSESRFYDIEPGDVMENIEKMSTILDKCHLDSFHSFKCKVLSKEIHGKKTISRGT